MNAKAEPSRMLLLCRRPVVLTSIVPGNIVQGVLGRIG